MNGMVQQWYQTNIQLLTRLYNRVDYDNIEYKWVLVWDVDLPPIFYQSHTNLLITTPGANIELHKNYNFYVDKNLTRKDGIKSQFLHETEWNPYRDMGYARLSYHLNSFNPAFFNIMEGDTLLGLVKTTYHFIGKNGG